MSKHRVTTEGELKDGERLIVQIEGREIGIFLKNGKYHAYLNWCPHQSGPVCEGTITGTQESSFDRETLELETHWTREGQILNCPWHGWEFDINTGECLSRGKIKLPTYPVDIENGEIVVSL